jgi:hypothetical protein
MPFENVILPRVQIVQTNNNESNWRKMKDTTTFYCKQAKDMWIYQENQKKIKKYIFDKIHKELKLNVDRHIKININHNLLQV